MNEALLSQREGEMVERVGDAKSCNYKSRFRRSPLFFNLATLLILLLLLREEVKGLRGTPPPFRPTSHLTHKHSGDTARTGRENKQKRR